VGLPQNFPKSPYEILDPERRWRPDEGGRQKSDAPIPPLVRKLRVAVKEWRDLDYEGASATSRALLRWWFKREHSIETAAGLKPFRYYFAQREAVETVIYLYEKARARRKYDLLHYDESGEIKTGSLPEDWLRLVIKMATGSGKTKVMSLLIAWSYFHRMYDDGSELARNFLLIAPNIIVLERLKTDFAGKKIFWNDPILPDNGFEGQNWRDDFQMTVHIQDNARAVGKFGNLFLTNIQRVYNIKDRIPSADDEDATEYFLGPKPVAKTTDSKVNLAAIVRDLDELMALNDEAHHIHDDKLAWFKSIEDINNAMKMRGKSLSLQIDVSATPKHNDGAIFVQTISDYPLVEAIYQDVVKHPVLPDAASRADLQERHQAISFTEHYQDYIQLGYVEWRKAHEEYGKIGKKAILFIMTDDTKNCDDVAQYLKDTYSEFGDKDAVLTIHTKKNGEISEATTGKNEEELTKLRAAANEIDDFDNPHKAIVSVLMLKEGWDVKNVTTIVGLRPYSAKSNILPEQTLGRGLRRITSDANVSEQVSVIGTDAFMEFVESIRTEGVELEQRAMGASAAANAPMVIEVDRANPNKDIDALDIHIPVLAPRWRRDYQSLDALKPADFEHDKLTIGQFDESERRRIQFYDLASEQIAHTTDLDSGGATNYQNVLGYFARQIMDSLKLVSEYDILFGKLKEFVANHLFEKPVELTDGNTLRNLAEPHASRTIIETFKQEINKLNIEDAGERVAIKDRVRVSAAKPFSVTKQDYVLAQKSVFNKIVATNNKLELDFAKFLERCADVVAYAKIYPAVGFKIDYIDDGGEIRDYYPDFLVKVSDAEIYVVETKGREDLDDLAKAKRARQWCEDVNAAQDELAFKFLYVKQEDYENYKPANFAQLIALAG